ncbi:MAG TPA: hypothetical protein VK576_08860 [Thermoleophilia bacterium]|nr:hypothetical protein [Thermoleophilia bacterium]
MSNRRTAMSSASGPASRALVALCAVVALLAGPLVWARPAAAAINVDDYTSGRFTTHTSEPAFLRYPTDDAGHVSYRVGALKIHPPTLLPVYLLGDSLVRECITTQGDMAARLATASGVTTSVYDLGSGNQSFAETLAIIDNLPPGPGVVAISVSQNRFARTDAQIRPQVQASPLLLQSTTLWRFILKVFGSAPRNSILPGIKAYLADYRLRNAATLAKGRTPHNVYVQHRQNGVLPPDRKQHFVASWLATKGAPGGAFDQWDDVNGLLLERAVTRAQQRGMTVVLMEGTCDRAFVGSAWDRYQWAYRTICQKVVADTGATYIDPYPIAGLVSDDFHDVIHLLEPGRYKWMDALATQLAPTVAGVAGTTPPSPAQAP